VGIDRLPDDRAGPAAADSSGTAPADLPVIPNGRSRLPHDHPDSEEVRSISEDEANQIVERIRRTVTGQG
jgi:hypothetical protein